MVGEWAPLTPAPAHSVWEIIGQADGGLSVLRTFRLLRVLKLVRFMPALRRQLVVLMKTMDNVATFCMLLMLFIFIFRWPPALLHTSLPAVPPHASGLGGLGGGQEPPGGGIRDCAQRRAEKGWDSQAQVHSLRLVRAQRPPSGGLAWGQASRMGWGGEGSPSS